MRRDVLLLDLARIGARRMQECSARAPGAVDDLLRESLEVIAVIRVLVADSIHQPAPATPDADHFVTFPQRADRHCANGGIQPGTSPPPVKIPLTPLFFQTSQPPEIMGIPAHT